MGIDRGNQTDSQFVPSLLLAVGGYGQTDASFLYCSGLNCHTVTGTVLVR